MSAAFIRFSALQKVLSGGLINGSSKIVQHSCTLRSKVLRKASVSWLQRMYTNGVSETCGAVTITTDPCVVLVDEKFSVKVSGLESRQKITVKSTIREYNCVFSGCGCYEAGIDGQVDVTTQPSMAGTYTGVDDMGLIWSMKQAPGQRAGLRLITKDVTAPQVVDLSVFNGHLSFDDMHSEVMVPIAETKVERWYKAHNVTRIPIREGKIRGTLFVPEGSQPLPGVIDMFGSAGGCIEFRASLLASRGFVVLALAFFGYEDLPDSLMSMNLDYFREAVQFVNGHQRVQSGGIGLLGVSSGAGFCQLMALHCPEVKAIVSINGVPTVFLFDIGDGDKVLKTTRPFGDVMNALVDWNHEEGVVFQKMVETHTSDFFPLWEADCKMLSICSAADMNVDPAVQKAQYDAYPVDQRHKIELVTYPGAGHLVEPPYSPHLRVTYNKTFKLNVVNGGYPEQHARAQEDSWNRIQNFFRSNLINVQKSRL